MFGSKWVDFDYSENRTGQRPLQPMTHSSTEFQWHFCLQSLKIIGLYYARVANKLWAKLNSPATNTELWYMIIPQNLAIFQKRKTVKINQFFLHAHRVLLLPSNPRFIFFPQTSYCILRISTNGFSTILINSDFSSCKLASRTQFELNAVGQQFISVKSNSIKKCAYFHFFSGHSVRENLPRSFWAVFWFVCLFFGFPSKYTKCSRSHLLEI